VIALREFIRYIYRNIVPQTLRAKYASIKIHKLTLKIIKYLKKNADNDVEKLSIIAFLENNSFSVFPYDFIKKYKAEDIAVYSDECSKLKYVLYQDKRMYFPETWEERQIKNYYAGLLIEQDIESPHRYETSDFCVKERDVVADIGVAEGIFALSSIEKAKKMYLFESDPIWMPALKKTFEIWKDKVVIVNKCVSDAAYKKYITLDDFLTAERLILSKPMLKALKIVF
jgi:hypothetical protein